MTESKIELRCPKCSISIMVSNDQAGEKVDCSRCQNTLLVPGVKKSAARKPVAFDDLIDIDDDEISNNLAGDAIEAASFGGKKANETVEGFAKEKATEAKKAVENSAPELQLADEKPTGPVDENADESALESSAETDPGSEFDLMNDEDDDLGDLLDIPKTQAPIPPAGNVNDPFEVDENKDLAVEGVTPADGQFPIDCKVCGSLLYARVSQVGTQIKCHDCYSLVDVEAPKQKPTPIEPTTTSASDEGDGGYQLSEPVDLPALDPTFDNTLGDIDFDDDEFFEARKEKQLDQIREAAERAGAMAPEEDEGVELEVVEETSEETNDIDNAGEVNDTTEEVVEAKPQKAKPIYIDEDDDGEDYSLAPSESRSVTQSTNDSILQDFTLSDLDSEDDGVEIVDDGPVDSSKPEVDSEKKEPEKTAGNRLPADKRPAAKKKTIKDRLEEDNAKPLEHFEDASGLFGGIGTWIRGCTTPFQSAMFLLRLALAIIVIGIAYLIISYGFDLFEAEDANKLSMFFAFGVVLFGMVPMALGGFGFASVANPIIQSAINQDETVGEFPEFSMGTFLGEMLYVGTSFWAASLPGVLLGAIVAAVREDPFWIVFFAIISSLMFVPIFLSSVMHHQSPWMLVSDKVLKTIGSLKFRWIRFFVAAFLIGLFVASSLVLTRFGAFGFVVAGFQLVALGLYYWMLGDLVGYVMRRIQNDATE